MVLVDTSVWIDFLRNRETRATKLLEAQIDLCEVAINAVIFNEICLGAVDQNQFKKYASYFNEIPFLPLKDWHYPVAELRFALKKKGITSFLPDALIAYTALEQQLPLLTTDKDFAPFAKFFGLQLL